MQIQEKVTEKDIKAKMGLVVVHMGSHDLTEDLERHLMAHKEEVEHRTALY